MTGEDSVRPGRSIRRVNVRIAVWCVGIGVLAVASLQFLRQVEVRREPHGLSENGRVPGSRGTAVRGTGAQRLQRHPFLLTQNGAGGIIDGSQHPEMIPDDRAYHIGVAHRLGFRQRLRRGEGASGGDNQFDSPRGIGLDSFCRRRRRIQS